jgi:hypothetical protein
MLNEIFSPVSALKRVVTVRWKSPSVAITLGLFQDESVGSLGRGGFLTHSIPCGQPGSLQNSLSEVTGCSGDVSRGFCVVGSRDGANVEIYGDAPFLK